MPVTIRAAAPTDLAGMEQVLVAAYEAEASSFVRLRSATANMRWLVAEEAGAVVGCVYGILYGEVAYVGLMAVHPLAQRRGIGEALMNRLLSLLEAHGVRTVLLDASEDGARLYARLGFTEIDTLVRYTREETPAQRQPLEPGLRLGVRHSDLSEVDRRVWGCDRGEILDYFLREAGQSAAVSLDSSGRVDGYVLMRKRTVGPWLAENAQSAKLLLRYALSTLESAPLVYVPAANAVAAALLTEHGFAPVMQFAHMARGAASPVRRHALFGQGTPGTG